jgi:hypothetical protein
LAILALGLLVVLVPSSRPAAEVRSGDTATTSSSTTTSTSTSTTATTLELVAEPVTTTTTAPPPVATPAVASPQTLMLIGDSMAFTAGLGLAPHAPAYDFVLANEGINGCGVVRPGPYRYFGAQREMEARCIGWPDAWRDALARNNPAMVAIVVGRWELMDRFYDGRWTNLFDPAFAGYLEAELEGAVQLVRSSGARVVLFTTPYYRRGLQPDGSLFPEDDPARVDAVNAMIRRVGERLGASVVDVGARLSPEGRYARDVDGVRVRSDGVHLTAQAGALLAPWLFPQLQVLAASPPPAPSVPPEAWSAPVS